jgi:hypothetical protein
MPTKDEQIEALKKENESLREQLRYCKIAVEGKPSGPDTTQSGNEPVLAKSSEETKQS